MKRPRAPYAKRSVWVVVAILGAVLVVVCGIGGYEINHLHNEVSGLQTQVNYLNVQNSYIKSALQAALSK
jgi:outer membrane murein-binding lipoprotein Lpp